MLVLLCGTIGRMAQDNNLDTQLCDTEHAKPSLNKPHHGNRTEHVKRVEQRHHNGVSPFKPNSRHSKALCVLAHCGTIKEGRSSLVCLLVRNGRGGHRLLKCRVRTTLRITGFCTLSIVRNSKCYKNTTFRKLDLFPSSGEGRKTPTLLGPLEIASLSLLTTNVPIQVILRPTVGRPVRLGVPPQFHLFDNYFLSSSCRATSLTRGRVCNLQCNQHWLESRRTHHHI
jgi:hypothetical protein